MGDSRRVFPKNMSQLYLLAFLLTTDQVAAERCLVTGLEDCVEGNAAFKGWARAWSKRTIIKNAIEMMAPTPNQAENALPICPGVDATSKAEALIAAVTRLAAFDRFVFVIAVLEGYSDRDCSALLHSTLEEVAKARARTLQAIAKPSEASHKSTQASSRPGRGVISRNHSLCMKTRRAVSLTVVMAVIHAICHSRQSEPAVDYTLPAETGR
jgi:hypothetical protein